MAQQLTKIKTLVSATQGIPATSGTPAQPARVTYVDHTVCGPWSYEWVLMPGQSDNSQVELENGELITLDGEPLVYEASPVPGRCTTTTTVVVAPATDAVPPRGGTRGTPEHTEYYLGWNAGARLIQDMVGDGEFSFSVPTGSTNVAVGTTSGSHELAYQSLSHAFKCGLGKYTIVENGVSIYAGGVYNSLTKFSIIRNGTQVNYAVDDGVVFTSNLVSDGQVSLDACLYTGGDSVVSAKFTSRLPSKGVCNNTLMSLLGLATDQACRGRADAVLPPLSGSSYRANESHGLFSALCGIAGELYSQSSNELAKPTGLAYGSVALSVGGADNRMIPLMGVCSSTVGGVARINSFILPLKGFSGSGVYGDVRGVMHPPLGWSESLPKNVVVAPSPTVSSYSGGTAHFLAPSSTLVSEGHSSYGEQAALLTAPRPVLTIRTGANAKSLKPPVPTLGSTGTVTILATSTLTAPKPTLAATMTVAGMATADLSAPSSPTLASYTGAVVRTLRTTSKPSLSASVTVGSVARASVGPAAPALSAHTGATARLQPPAPTLAAEVLSGGLADAALSTTTRAKLVGYSGAVCSVSITGKPTVTASGTTGGVASLAVVCPLFELTAAATAQNHGSASLLAPSPRLGAQAQAWLAPPIARLTAIGSATITATYEAYAVNLGHRPRVTNQELPIDEVTHYTNFPFTHVVRYQNSYYGANSTGLYLLEGTTDAGTEIPWAVKTAMDDFKTPLKKTVASAYFGGRFGPASTVQLHAGEQAPNTYSFSTPRDRLAQNHRQVFGKGVKERYYALGASGTGVCELDTVELETHNMTRRI